MAECIVCGQTISFWQGDRDRRCGACVEENRWPDGYVQVPPTLGFPQPDEAAIAKVLLTTETSPDVKILERIEIVTAEVAYGMNIFKDMFAGIRDVVGGRSKAVQSTLRDARRTALHELKREAHAVGANAVIAVDLDYVALSSTGTMVMLVASGTAVRIAPQQ